jgi:hypothetical protein
MQKYTDVVTSARSGAAVPDALVTVKTSPAGATATIYSDDGVTTQSNPLTTDSNGEFTFYAADGEYTLTVSGTGITSRTIGPIILHDPADSDDYMPSTDVSFTPSGSGAVSRTVQGKLRYLVSVEDFGTNTTPGTTDMSTAIAAAITEVTSGGGVVVFEQGETYNIGTTTITVPDNVMLVGQSSTMGAAGGGGDGGTIIKYTGTGDAIRGNGCKAVTLKDIIVDGSGTTGASAVGVALRGAWGCSLIRVSVTGITPAKGHGILVKTTTAAAGAWGAQHNYLEMCECADGILRFEGSASNDQVTTTVVNTFRGTQIEASHASIIYINTTAEKSGSITSGFLFEDTGSSFMVGCDVEGAYTNGISITDTHKVRDGGSTVFDGFSGTNRISGYMTDWTLYGSGIDLRDDAVTAGNLINGDIAYNDENAYYAFIRARANNVTGGAQDGHLEISRRIAGTEVLQMELRNYLRIEHSVSIANVATTVLTIPIATNKGIRVTAHAEGIQTGAGAFSCYRDAVVVNGAGTVTVTQGTETEIAAGGAAPAFTYTVSTTNILVQFNHASATPTTINFVITIDGPVNSYTLG